MPSIFGNQGFRIFPLIAQLSIIFRCCSHSNFLVLSICALLNVCMQSYIFVDVPRKLYADRLNFCYFLLVNYIIFQKCTQNAFQLKKVLETQTDGFYSRRYAINCKYKANILNDSVDGN